MNAHISAMSPEQGQQVSPEAASTLPSHESPLRREIVELGKILGHVISEVAGEENLQLVETIRRLSRDFRQGLGDGVENERLQNLLASLDYEHLRIVIRAFTVFLDLANMAEDRERVRVLRNRRSQSQAAPPSESIQAAISALKSLGKTPQELRQLVDSLHLELVFTAHPTEAKRRSIRNKLRMVRDLLEQRDSTSLDPTVSQRIDKSIYAELTKLWLTDFIRPWRPTVLQEVQRGLSFGPNLWRVTPQITDNLRRALENDFPGEKFEVNPCVHFGSWIGGDRDGHPFVTPEVTVQTLIWLRNAAIDFHLQNCKSLRDSFSISTRQVSMPELLEQRIVEAKAKWGELSDRLGEVPPGEILRQWLVVVQWRLWQTKIESLESVPESGAYLSAEELLGDVLPLHSTLLSIDSGKYLADETSTWLDRINTFGLHLARLDVRQDARTYSAVIDELFERTGLVEAGVSLSERERHELLTSTMDRQLDLPEDNLSATSKETLTLFRLLRLAVKRLGYEVLGSHVISMTSQPSDVLSVMWLWNHAESDSDVSAERLKPISIVPLFETIDDLKNARRILADLLHTPQYRDLLRSQRDQQTVMLGYSDSTKDGGYLAATWSLYECQQDLQQLANDLGIALVFFHGRGGSLGRGGGPAARGILSLPRQAFHGALRLTEQGEVLADRYDDPNIAYRHLEQLVWSSILAS